MQQVVLRCKAFFEHLELELWNRFVPTTFGCEISSADRDLFSLPLHMGGLNILNPTEVSPATTY